MAAYASGDQPPIAMHRPWPVDSDDAHAVRRAMERVLVSGRFVRGGEVSGFEVELGDFLGVEHVVGVASGSDALELSLRALGIGIGHRVVTVANACYYSTAAICVVGATPVLVDVDPVDALIDVVQLQQVLGGVDAVVLTHLYGDASRGPQVAALCRAAGVPLIEDCAQSVGAEVNGVRAGALGDIAAMSFYPTKNLAALGDGGAVVTNDAGLAATVRQRAHHGWGRRFEVVAEGGNSRLDELQAAILRERLPLLDRANGRRREIWSAYREAVGGSTARMVGEATSASHAAHLAVTRVENRDLVREHLAAADVESDVHYPIPDHHQPLWQSRFSVPRLPVTEGVAQSVLTVPCYSSLTDAEVERVASALKFAVMT